MRLMAFLSFFASLFGAGCKPAAPVTAAPPNGAEAMRELRTMMLTTSASESGFQSNETFPEVFGVVMDLAVSDDGTVTIVSMCDGHGSLYTTGTFGILGGIGHEPVRIASKNFVTEAQSHYDAAAPTTAFPYPAADHVRFYLLGFDGVRVIEAESSAVENREHSLSAMWIAGQQVLTELRILYENRPQEQ